MLVPGRPWYKMVPVRSHPLGLSPKVLLTKSEVSQDTQVRAVGLPLCKYICPS